MFKHIKSGDQATVISGSFKGQSGKVVKVDRYTGKAMLEGINVRTRHLKKTQWNPAGGKKDIHVGIDISNLKVTEHAEQKSARKQTKKEVA